MRIVALVLVGMICSAVFAAEATPRDNLIKDIRQSMAELKSKVNNLKADGAPVVQIRAEMVATHAKVWTEAWSLAIKKMASKKIKR